MDPIYPESQVSLFARFNYIYSVKTSLCL
ncbi:hypothetical protein METHP14_990015 [Pseudomonas sp. P14-2025]